VATSLFVLVAAVGSCVDGLGGRREPVRLAAEQAGATVSGTADGAPEAAPPTTAPPTTAKARVRASTTMAPPTTARVKATSPPTTRRPRPTTTRPPAPDCHPSYSGCLRIGIGDYDCAGGSGNGPNYVEGPVRVRGIDPFDLDRDGDGWGCES